MKEIGLERDITDKLASRNVAILCAQSFAQNTLPSAESVMLPQDFILGIHSCTEIQKVSLRLVKKKYHLDISTSQFSLRLSNILAYK